MKNKLLFGLLFVLVFSAYSVAAAGNSAGGLWKFDNNAIDTINGNNGVATGVTYGVGVDGQAAIFGNSIVTVPSISGYSFPNGLTVEALVKLDATSHGYIIAQPGAYLLQVAPPEASNSNFRFQGGLYKSVNGVATWGNFIDANAPVQLGKWYYVAYTYDGSKASLYVNGVLQNSMTYSNTPVLFSTNPVVIGNRATTMDRALKGMLDNVEFTNRAKSSAEIASRYTNLVQPTCIPKTCTVLGKSCGMQDNGCGTQINCGSCATGVCNVAVGMCVAELPGCKAYEDIVVSQSVIIADSSDVACGLSVTKLFTSNGFKAYYGDNAPMVWLVGIVVALLVTFAFSKMKKRK